MSEFEIDNDMDAIRKFINPYLQKYGGYVSIGLVDKSKRPEFKGREGQGILTNAIRVRVDKLKVGYTVLKTFGISTEEIILAMLSFDGSLVKKSSRMEAFEEGEKQEGVKSPFFGKKQ